MKNGTVHHLVPDAKALAEAVADWMLIELRREIGPQAVALSGGNTPKPLYELLGSPKLRAQLPWAEIHWFFGDERFVPHDHPDSNYRMVKAALLDRAPIPPENVHPIPFEGTPEQSAAAYEKDLKQFYGTGYLDPDRPLFTVNLLGLGADGHTASLFPGTAALQEKDRWAVAVVGAKPEPRISLTYPVLDSSRSIALLVAGADKREQLGKLIDGTSTAPASRIHPTRGRLHIFMDQAAAPEDVI